MSIFRFAAALLFAVSTFAVAQGFPDKSKPIHLVVPFGAGSGSDLIVRAYAQAMNEQGNVTVVVDNKPGADGVIGTEFGKNAPADGYTVLFGNLSTMVLNVHMLPTLPYDPVADFTPIAATNNVALVLNAGPSTTFRSIKDVVDAARAAPGKYSLGAGTASIRLAGEMVGHLAGVQFLTVPFKTQAQATTALAGGQIDLLVTDAATAAPHYSGGRLRPLGTTGRTRLTALPNVPTIAEQGIKDYEFSAWHGLFVPAKTPPEVLDQLRAMIRKAAGSKYVADALANNSADPLSMDTAQLRAHLRADLDRWGQLLRAMKMSVR